MSTKKISSSFLMAAWCSIVGWTMIHLFGHLFRDIYAVSHALIVWTRCILVGQLCKEKKISEVPSNEIIGLKNAHIITWGTPAKTTLKRSAYLIWCEFSAALLPPNPQCYPLEVQWVCIQGPPAIISEWPEALSSLLSLHRLYIINNYSLKHWWLLTDSLGNHSLRHW